MGFVSYNEDIEEQRDDDRHLFGGSRYGPVISQPQKQRQRVAVTHPIAPVGSEQVQGASRGQTTTLVACPICRAQVRRDRLARHRRRVHGEA